MVVTREAFDRAAHKARMPPADCDHANEWVQKREDSGRYFTTAKQAVVAWIAWRATSRWVDTAKQPPPSQEDGS